MHQEKQPFGNIHPNLPDGMYDHQKSAAVTLC
jgi:hypothetical protein